MTTRRSKTNTALPDPPCLDVSVNGKRVAKVGMRGEGGANVFLSAWRRHHTRTGTRTQPMNAIEFHLGGTDRNDPVWDRFYDWPAPSLRLGDEISIRVADGVPDKAKFRFKNHRFGEDQMPSPENPTYVVVRNVSVWADKGGVLLRANDKGNVPRLTANGARKVAKALIRAADEFERSRRKARR